MLLAKISCFRPHIICFVGKGIWLHVERSLRLRISDDAGCRADLAAHPSETGVILKEEEEELQLFEYARAAKPEPELVGFREVNSEKPGVERNIPPKRSELQIRYR